MSTLIVLLVLVACATEPGTPSALEPPDFIGPVRPTLTAGVSNTPLTPLPEPTIGPAFTEYKARRGDTLGLIADRYDVNVQDLMQMNNLTDPNALQVGQLLRIPVEVDKIAPEERLIPDSELVYGPAYNKFDVGAFVRKYPGYLSGYRERVENAVMSGPEIIQLVSERFSIGPRILLAILEMQGGWVTSSAIGPVQLQYPLGILESTKSGLYKQAFYLASYLNEGYYGKVTGRLTALEFRDRRRARLAQGVNPGTAAIQDAFAHETTWDNWLTLTGPNGFLASYQKLFGNPFQYAVEPVLPRNLQQPPLRLPLEDGFLWYFTGGPHSAWADGSAWAALDFTPKDEAGSCWTSAYWAVAAAPGRVVQAERGRVLLNLSGDQFQGTGWSLMYMHMASEGRAEIGTVVKVGDHIGHPSCEGGAAETSHLHFARMYNGQWIPAADSRVPFVLSGWVVQGGPQEYDGKLVRGDVTRDAVDAQVAEQNGVIAEGSK